MTNIFQTPEKGATKGLLFQAGIDVLQQNGWSVEKAGLGKSSVRKITKGKDTKLVSIRTSQDTWIAFPRTSDDGGWLTLDDVDYVVAVSVDNKYMPRLAYIHMIDATQMRERYDRAYAARKKAGYNIPVGRGVWLSLYEEETSDPVTLVGAGAGLKYPPIASVPLDGRADVDLGEDAPAEDEGPLTIAEAKRRLAMTFGVDPSAIKIIVEG
ncbi:hypothetical protein AB0V79_09060 [Mesorhizobium ciceri]|uniref:hypothetical protein n=1 Tax=Mesorhizobium TaxID=68287 RepID=UPI0007A938C8|nr:MULTISPECIES: hypothetical protein [Mesorhizobium]AMY03261.1 hypothetical protein A4R29_00050 [Mesorhizobium ciceri biovar biserrulae]MBZ9719730.1 hypothetical protein [Mesorhizobium sp. AD1-1]